MYILSISHIKKRWEVMMKIKTIIFLYALVSVHFFIHTSEFEFAPDTTSLQPLFEGFEIGDDRTLLDYDSFSSDESSPASEISSDLSSPLLQPVETPPVLTMFRTRVRKCSDPIKEKERRKRKAAESGKKYRERKKQKVADLEAEVQALRARDQLLTQKLAQSTFENKELVVRLAIYKALSEKSLSSLANLQEFCLFHAN
jgi:hypothetical protein